MRSLNLLFACTFAFGFTASAQTATYHDPKTGVAFQYPSVWKRIAKPNSMTIPMLTDAGLKPRVVFEFSPKGNLYAKTNLVSLDFLYYTAPAADAAACAKLGIISGEDDTKPTATTIHGVTFQHSQGSDAGMCHEMGADVYSTYRSGACYLFEEDFMTVCAGVVEGTRGLTDSENKVLQRHLDEITQSIVFTPAK